MPVQAKTRHDRSDMILIPSMRSLALAFALAGGGAAGPVLAQVQTSASANPDADRLAQEMRVLAADPRDMRALLEAGRLSARLGDTSAALAFYARAETLDPTNPRIAAGRGAALVRLERPGEALRLFQSAEARGLPARDYAAERGFAYDLIGQPGLAQRDYKLAVQNGGADDETVRRYALSLGGTGDVGEAMRLLDPLLRRSDRAAWRARAFILAMNGDVPGAERIAASMMPGNMGTALAPFFRRLRSLQPADRAYAVHFGELSPTQARLADARLAPALPRYMPEARPVQVAAAAPQTAARSSRDLRSRRQRGREVRQPAPTPTPAPVRMAAADLPPPPRAITRAAPAEIVQPLPKPSAEQIDNAPPVQLARAVPQPRRSTVVPAGSQAAADVLRAAPAASNLVKTSSRPVEVPPSSLQPGPSADIVVTRTGVTIIDRESATTPAGESADIAEAGSVALPAAAPAQSEPGREAPAVVATAAPVKPELRLETPAGAVATPPPPPPGPARVGEEDSVLAAIVNNLTIPASELEAVTNPNALAAVPIEPVLPPALASPPEPVRVAAVPKPEPVKSTAKPKPEFPKAKAEAKKVESKPAPKKPEPRKPEPKKPDEPARAWVQVAGGANEDTLPKAWKAVVAKAPAAFKGKTGWWTPVRASNRVLAGPFKSATEAQAFVNTLNKAGISGFVFTSEAGQKVSRIAEK